MKIEDIYLVDKQSLDTSRLPICKYIGVARLNQIVLPTSIVYD